MVFLNTNLNFQTQNRLIPQKPQDKTENFCGCTRLVMNTTKHPRPFFSTEDFLRIAALFKSKIAGKLPKDFLELFPEKPTKVFDFIDELADYTREQPFDEKEKKQLKLSSGKKLTITYLGYGGFGDAFKLNFNEKNYVLKVFQRPHSKEGESSFNHGIVAEARTGLYLCNKDYCDLLKFHIANFDDEKRWQIAEYIDKEKDSAENRPGKKVRESHPELIFGDQTSKKERKRNEINNIILDLGGIKKKGTIIPSMIIERDNINPYFYKFINNPSYENRKEIFYYDLNNPDFKQKNYLAGALCFLKSSDIKQAFYALLNHPDANAKKGLRHRLIYLDIDDPQAEINLQRKIEESLTTFSIVKN